MSLTQDIVSDSLMVNDIDTIKLNLSCVGVSSIRFSDTPSISMDFSLVGVKVCEPSPEMSSVSLVESVAVQVPEICSPQ